MRRVAVGPEAEGWIEITQRLAAGERVVTTGSFLLKAELLKSAAPTRDEPMGVVERFVAGALRQRLFVLLCVAALAVTGIVAWRDLPVEAFPDLTNNQVVIVTQAPGLAAPEIELRISYPIETALMGTPGAEEVRSLSKFGLSMVTVVFEDQVPTYLARQLVAERLAEARGRLPQGVEPTMGPVATAFGEIYQYLDRGRHRRSDGAQDPPRLGHPQPPARGARASARSTRGAASPSSSTCRGPAAGSRSTP